MYERTYKEQSKLNWESSSDRQARIDELTLGCLQRIADSTELMAHDYKVLLADVKSYRERCENLYKINCKLHRRISSLRGVITKLKKRQTK